MLQRHLLGTPTKFGVGANRAAVASHFIKKYGYIDICKSSWHEKQYRELKVQDSLDSEKIGVVVLDDAMQVMQFFSPLDYFRHFVNLLFHDFVLNYILNIPCSPLVICCDSYVNYHFISYCFAVSDTNASN